MPNNFFISFDVDGKLPVLSHDRPTKEYYIEYRNNRPVGGRPHPGMDCVWDYADGEMYALYEGVINHYTQKPLPVIDLNQ